jgi:hypothetical protein
VILTNDPYKEVAEEAEKVLTSESSRELDSDLVTLAKGNLLGV